MSGEWTPFGDVIAYGIPALLALVGAISILAGAGEFHIIGFGGVLIFLGIGCICAGLYIYLVPVLQIQ